MHGTSILQLLVKGKMVRADYNSRKLKQQQNKCIRARGREKGETKQQEAAQHKKEK